MHEVERLSPPREGENASERFPALGWLDELEEEGGFGVSPDLRMWYREPARRPPPAEDEG